jgi:hypothetical protein
MAWMQPFLIMRNAEAGLSRQGLDRPTLVVPGLGFRLASSGLSLPAAISQILRLVLYRSARSPDVPIDPHVTIPVLRKREAGQGQGAVFPGHSKGVIHFRLIQRFYSFQIP